MPCFTKENLEMSGVKLLVDTNVIIKHLAGDEKSEKTLQGALLYISSITYSELLAGDLTKKEEIILSEYISNVHIIHTNDFICETAAGIRRRYNIAATGIFLRLPIVTFDNDFDAINNLQIIKLTV